jgi:hypothetical protein
MGKNREIWNIRATRKFQKTTLNGQKPGNPEYSPGVNIPKNHLNPLARLKLTQ